LRENVDGEAVEWAASRLRNRKERHKILLVVSDGAPVDDSTLAANWLTYLRRHLKQDATSIDEAKEVRLAAIGLDYDVSEFYAKNLVISAPDEFGSKLIPFVSQITAHSTNE
jgi:cobaltochelatase CobT